MLSKEIKIFFIILCFSLNFSATVSAQPPPPPESEISVTDSAAPADDFQIPFRSITLGNVSTRIITVFNTGTANLVIGDIGGLALPFSIVSDNCSGQDLEQASSCTFMVSFSPTSEGAITDDFDIPSNDSDENFLTISVSGTGLAVLSNNPPSAPQQIYPTDTQTTMETTVEFRWAESTDSDGENVAYDLYVCTDENFTVGCVTAVNIAWIENKGVFYANMGGNGTGLLLIGLVAAFVCGGMNGRKKVAVLLAITGIIALLIISCGGGGSDADSIVPPTGTDTTSETTYTTSGLSTGTTYYWKVVARDETGEETSSDVRSFSTE